MDERSGLPETAQTGVELEPSQLSAVALRGLVEEFVTREGTDYGHLEWTLEDKVSQVYRQLETGEVRIVFDPELESASIVATTEAAPAGDRGRRPR